MKRTVAFFLILCVLLSLTAISAFASSTDAVFSQSQSVTVSFVKYNTFSVNSDATVTLRNCGFEIAGSLSVEDGSSLVGVEQAGDFCFSLCKGCRVSGVLLYYYDENESGERTYYPIPLTVFDNWEENEYLSELGGLGFKWDTAIGAWCVPTAISGNPFHLVFYHTDADMSTAEGMALDLWDRGLFKGTGTKADGSVEFSLGRAPTRVEALVMLIRLLGKEEEALGGEWTHPFTDVPEWADSYIGYAYENGLTQGVSATSFGTSNATITQYLTFVLRALGYTDSDTSSTLYNEALRYGEELGLTVNKNEQNDWDRYPVCEEPFWRADVAVISFRALNVKMKNGNCLIDSFRQGNHS